jgi:hypothetical protein
MTTKRLTKMPNGEYKWIPIEDLHRKPKSSKNGLKEDLTIDGYINKYGAVYNHGDGKIYTTKNGYMDALKRNGQHIKDYK